MKEVAIGVDIGGTFTKFGIVDQDGNCLIDGTISTTEKKDIDGFWDDAVGAVIRS